MSFTDATNFKEPEKVLAAIKASLTKGKQYLSYADSKDKDCSLSGIDDIAQQSGFSPLLFDILACPTAGGGRMSFAN